MNASAMIAFSMKLWFVSMVMYHGVFLCVCEREMCVGKDVTYLRYDGREL